MSTPEAPAFVCQPWVTGADIAAECDALDFASDPAVYDPYAQAATEILYAASGRQYSGGCITTVRPCVKGCGCWPLGWGYDFSWNASGFWIGGGGNGVAAVQDWIGGGCPPGDCCGWLSRVKLSGYPVTEILEVKIDGNVIPPEDYRLDNYKWLTYMDAPDGSKRRWPRCQNLAADDTEPGTFSVEYAHGILPPRIGLDAAVQLACALAREDEDCELPPGTTEVQRQGVTIALALRASSRRGELPPSLAGLTLVKSFLATVNPNGLTRRSAFYSPDTLQYARQVG